MRRAQVSLEYLLILTGVFAMALIVSAVVLMAFDQPSAQRDVQIDILECSENRVWLKDYFVAYDGTQETAPGAISHYSMGLLENPQSIAGPIKDLPTMCVLQGEFELKMGESGFYLRALEENWLNYTQSD